MRISNAILLLHSIFGFESSDKDSESYELEYTPEMVFKNLTVPKSHFQRWSSLGVSRNMINCCATQLMNRRPIYRKKLALLEISRNGEHIFLDLFDQLFQLPNNDVVYNRIAALKRGVALSVQYAKSKLNIQNFPNIYALVIPLDDAELIRAKSSYCTCSVLATQKEKRTGFKPCNVTMNSQNPPCNMTTSWPPILAQNRASTKNNIFALIPDFSYFTRFEYAGDHGSPKDIWFDIIVDEINFNNLDDIHKNDSSSPIFSKSMKSTIFYPLEFSKKKYKEVIWRGSIEHRLWKNLRKAISECNVAGWINSQGRYASRVGMCKDYQMIITVPGNGVWSWALKFNLVIVNYYLIKTNNSD